MVVGWVSVRRRRRRALGGEVVARPARGAFRSAGTSLAGGGFPCGGLGGHWAAPCSGDPFASLFIAAAAYGTASTRCCGRRRTVG
jgi:cytochrome c biogenesis protein CcdA